MPRFIKCTDEEPVDPVRDRMDAAAIGCADPLEQRTGTEVQDQIGRGIRGEGQIGPIERAPDDPAGEHGVPQTHP